MVEESLCLKLTSGSRDAVVMCLALGALESMRSGSWPLEAGIWTLGRPKFWEPLMRAGLPSEVVDIFQSADELDALEKLRGRPAAEELLGRMIKIIRGHLEALPEKYWCAEWLDGNMS